MFVLIWAILLYSVTGGNVGKDARKEACLNDFCITLNEGEITAETGLCAVIPCSFTTGSDFTPKHLNWSKCDTQKQRCSDSDTIFDTDNNNAKIQPGFRGRVSLLEPDVNQKNCSIVINDLTKSDSGSYQLRVISLTKDQKMDGFSFSLRANISVKDLMQKPTLMIPLLTEGKQTTLTCTAPGLCSGSVPQITWMWRRAGERDSHITGNVTALKNESVTSVAQRYSSTLTFHLLAEHHGTNITCKVSFTNNITAEETVTLNVTSVGEVNIITSVKENDTSVETVTCNVTSVGEVNTTGNTSVKENDTSVETYLLKDLLKTVQQPEVIIAFVSGILLSAVICCLATKCCRKKRRSAANMAETLEMITMQEMTDGIHDQQAAEEEAEATGQSGTNVDVEPKEVEYSDINFSKLNRSPTGEENTRETTETEYAEIKTEDIKKRQDNDREDGQIVEANGGEEEVELEEEEKERVEELKEEEKEEVEEEEEGMIGQDEETKWCMSAEKEEGEDVPLYSNIRKIMAEI